MGQSRQPCNEPAERWRPVVGWEGYYDVSDLGNIWSRHVGRILKGSTGAGYRMIRLCRTVDGVSITEDRYVHDLVLEAFVGPKPAGSQVRHGPSGPARNALTEICYGTRAENMGDRVRDGSDNRGEKHPLAKLTDAAVLEIRRRRAAGEKPATIAPDFPYVCYAVVSRVGRGHGWGHLK